MDQGVYGPIDENALRDDKAAAQLALDSGYDPDSVLRLPMTPELRAAIDQLRLTKSVSETEAGNIQRLKELEEQKDKKADAQRDAPNDAFDNIEPTEEYLNSSHSFGDIRMTGKQWAHLGKYAKDNEALLREQWAEEGVGLKTQNNALKTIEIMRRGPQNDEERSFIKETADDIQTKSLIERAAEQSGTQPQHVETIEQKVSTQPKADLSAEMTMGL